MVVTVYSTESCPWCHKTKEWLKENKVKFKDIDVGKNQKAAEEIMKRSGQQGVPVVDFNGKIIIGFDEVALKKALKSSIK